jgi:hypothetical protein
LLSSRAAVLRDKVHHHHKDSILLLDSNLSKATSRHKVSSTRHSSSNMVLLHPKADRQIFRAISANSKRPSMRRTCRDSTVQVRPDSNASHKSRHTQHNASTVYARPGAFRGKSQTISFV